VVIIFFVNIHSLVLHTILLYISPPPPPINTEKHKTPINASMLDPV
jgi:hypothetical protein